MKKYRKSKRYYYFRKQRSFGVALLLCGVLSIIATGGDWTAAAFLAIPGFGLLFTKEMWITDDYFYEMEAKKFDKWKEP